MKLNRNNRKEIIQEMTLEEKLDLIIGKTMFSSAEIPRLGIPSIRYLDGFTGINMMQYLEDLMDLEGMNRKDVSTPDSNNESGADKLEVISYAVGSEPIPEDFSEEKKEKIKVYQKLLDSIKPEGENPSCFPPGILTGASWNPEVVRECGAAVGKEAKAFGVDVLLGTPNVNIQRDPRNGRFFESYSEDPFLMKTLAPHFVKGVQEQGVIANVKHFAANNQETGRQRVDALVSRRALREIYFPGFKSAVQSGCKTVMSAYNKVNGASCAMNPWLLGTVLREEWGFDGQVVSDWGAVYDQTEALLAGNDMDMPGPRNKDRLYEAIESGRLPMEKIDLAVDRMLKVILDSPKYNGNTRSGIDREFSRKAAYHAVEEGSVLLKNDGILPLSPELTWSIMGKRALHFMDCGGGSAQVDTDQSTGLYEEAVKALGSSRVVLGEITEETDVAVITAGASGQEGRDRPDMKLDREDRVELEAALDEAEKAHKKIVLVLNIAGPVELTEYVSRADAVLCIFLPGMEGGHGAVDILLGKINPSGKLPCTFPKYEQDLPSYLNFPGEFDEVRYGEGIYVGYRYYEKKRLEPLYPFGYGLSYTSFELLGAEAKEEYRPGEEPMLEVEVTVKNSGIYDGREVVQLYLEDVKSKLDKPVKELKAFQKVWLKAGETKKVRLRLSAEDFCSYDSRLGRWTLEPGVYMLHIGNSSQDTPIRKRVKVIGENPYGYGTGSTAAEIFTDPRAVEICNRYLGQGVVDPQELSNMLYYFGETPAVKVLERYCRSLGFDENQAGETERKIFKELGEIDLVSEE